jgi:hypothetical protein
MGDFFMSRSILGLAAFFMGAGCCPPATGVRNAICGQKQDRIVRDVSGQAGRRQASHGRPQAEHRRPLRTLNFFTKRVNHVSPHLGLAAMEIAGRFAEKYGVFA